jgi:hypothetical protein
MSATAFSWNLSPGIANGCGVVTRLRRCRAKRDGDGVIGDPASLNGDWCNDANVARRGRGGLTSFCVEGICTVVAVVGADGNVGVVGIVGVIGLVRVADAFNDLWTNVDARGGFGLGDERSLCRALKSGTPRAMKDWIRRGAGWTRRRPGVVLTLEDASDDVGD